MSFNAKEIGAYTGNPIELYEFRNGLAVWRYTSADEPFLWDGNTFFPEPIKSPEATETQELGKLNITLTVPRTNEVAMMYNHFPPTAVTTLTIYRKHRDDDQIIVHWVGRVLNSDFRGSTADLYGEPNTTAIKRIGLRRYYQRQCPHVLFGDHCRASADAHKVPAVVSAVSGLIVEVDVVQPDSYWAGGMMSWDSAIGTQWRFILNNAGSTLQVNFPFMPDADPYGRGLPVSTAVNLYPGCQHTMTDCINKFNNLPNYGGQPYIPMQNPFNLTSLF